MDKLKATLTSRKFWFTVAAIAVSVTLFLTGQISPNEFMSALSIAAGVYVGALGVEDGLTKAAPFLLKAVEKFLRQRE